jgi:hypothetical protein
MSSPYAPFTGFGDDTNSSVKFGIMLPADEVPLWELEPRLSKFAIPHSNRTTTQYGGLGEWSVSFVVDIDTTDALVMLQQLQGQQATLRYQYRITNNPGGDVETIGNVTYVVLPETLLDNVSRVTRDVGDTCTATLTFTRTADPSSYYGFALYGEPEE